MHYETVAVRVALAALLVASSPISQATLRISEFMAVNTATLQDEDGDTPDWIELLNDGAAPADLSDYTLTDDADAPTKWAFPDGLTIGPGETLIVFASDKNRTPLGGELHTSFKLSGAGEYLALVAPDGTTVSHAYTPAFPQQFPDVSYGLDPDTPATGYFTAPTPGARNGTPGPVPVGAVEVSEPSQVFTATLTVTLSNHLPDATILYTTDGSDPATAGTAYDTPLTLTTSTGLRAVATLPGGATGPATTRHYLRLADDTAAFSSPLPVVVLENFDAGRVPQRNSSTGPNGNDGSGVVQVERQPVLMAIFDRDTQTGQASPASPPAIVSHAGIRVRGSSSAGLRKKSFSLETWRDGVREEADNIAPFGMPTESDWVLYAPTETFGNNRYDRSLLHNSFIYQLSNEIGRYAVRTQFVEVFLNTGGGDLTMADYAGLYIFMEKRKRDRDRIRFEPLSQDGTSGGWMINVDRMDPLPVGGVGTPLHFHTPGPDRVLQTQDDSPFGVRGRDDRPEFYHSFFNFESPDGYVINPTQRSVIQNAMNEFEDALYGPGWTNPDTGYTAHIDVDNFVDHYILNNLTKNQDAYVLSTLLYRETPDAPIRFGPIWDFDRGYNTSPTSTNPRANLRFADRRMWFGRLFDHTDFEQKYIDRWQLLREGAFATAHMDAIIDAQAAEITAPVAVRNGTSSWPSKVAAMKSWLATRTSAIDARFTPRPTIGPQHGSTVQVSHPAYYTTDGTDPRQPGGAVSPSARSTAGGQFATTLVRADQTCRYHVPTDGSLSTSWTGTFDDSAWNQAAPGVGWESPIVPTLTPAIGTDIESEMRRINAGAYFRWSFELDDPANINTLTLGVIIDDGFVAYLNGTRIGDFNAPDPISWNAQATGSRSDSAVLDSPVQIDATPFRGSLITGANTLAIHAMNATPGGSDFLISAKLDAEITIPPGIVTLGGSATITARTLDGDDWSGPASATFIVGNAPASADNLVISEIMYHPADSGTEFIELMNISSEPIDLSGTSFTRGIDFTFPAGGSSVLQPGARTVVDVAATGTDLDNGGETITLTALDGQRVRHFRYNDKAPWPTAADGDGFSLVLDLPTTNPDHSLPSSWRSSVTPGGSPGTSDTGRFTGDPHADDDGDGLTALLEFATAGHDTTTLGADSVFSFLRNLAAGNIRYTVEHSADLITWQTDSLILDETNHGDGTATVRYQVPGSPGRKHVRLRVTSL